MARALRLPWRVTIIAACLLAACTRPAERARQVGVPAVPAPSTATIEGVVDVEAGTLVIRSLGGASGRMAMALPELPVVQDGVPGSGPPDTLELVTEDAKIVGGGCGAVDAFEGRVRARSFYAGYRLENVYVEIVSMTPTGHEGCNSAAAVPGVSDQYGLFSYGDLAAAGSPGDSAVATWRFRLPDTTRFVFTGRVMGDLVDDTAPVTAAAPPGGTFTAATSVSLACADAGSGCAATYYTLDGTAPTLASARYSGPIPIAATTTLRFFSVDVAGNAETPRAETYVVDGVAPTVVSVDPYDGQGDVAASAVVTVEFSEPMDAATIPGAFTVTGPGGPVAGTVAAGAGSAWTFTPAAPLAPAGTYAVRVSAAARDVAGNPLVAFASRFSTATPVETVNGAGTASYRSAGIAYDAAGNGLAVFSTYSNASGTGGRLLYSRYDAALGTWLPEQVLDPEPSSGSAVPVPTKVVSDGESFLAVWENGAGSISAVRFTGGVPGPAQVIGGPGAWLDGAFDVVAATGRGYAVLFIDEGLQAWTHDGSAWDPAGPTVVTSSLYAHDPAIVAVGSSFVVAYHETDYTTHTIGTGRYDPVTRTWATAVLPGTSGSAYLLPPTMASNGTAVVVGWGTTTGPVMASIDVGGGFGQAVNVSNGYGDRSYQLSAAASGARFALGWMDRPAAGVASGYGAVFNGVSWTGSSTLEARPGAVAKVLVAPCGAGFAAAVEIDDSAAVPVPSSIWVNQTTSGGYWSSANLTAVESRSADATDLRLAQRGGSVAVAWDQDDGSRHQVHVATFDGASVGPAAAVVTPGKPGSNNGVRIAGDGHGNAAAVWVGDDRGNDAVFAALRSGGAWSAPVRVSLDAASPAVASNGQGFMITWIDVRKDGPAIGVRAAPFVAGQVGASTLLEAGNTTAPSIASDGSGYLVAWRRATDQDRAAIYASGSWGAAVNVSNYQSGRWPYAPVVAGHPGAYLVGWIESYSGYSLVTRRAVAAAPGGPWTWDPVQTVATSLGPTTVFAVSAAQSTFGVTWYDAITGAYAAVQSGGVWGPRATVVASPPYCNAVQMAASSEGYLAAASCTGLRVLGYRSAWDAAATSIGNRAETLAISADGASFKVLALQADGAGYGAFAIDMSADGRWWPARRLEGGLQAPVGTVSRLASTFDGQEHVGVWIRPVEPSQWVVRSRAAY